MGRGSPLLLVLVLVLLAGAGWMVLAGDAPTGDPTDHGGASPGQPTSDAGPRRSTAAGDLELPEPGQPSEVLPVEFGTASEPAGARTQADRPPSPGANTWAWPKLEQLEFAVRGTVFVGGEPAGDVPVRLTGAERAVASQTSTDAAGRFTLRAKSGVAYAVTIEQPGLFPFVLGIGSGYPGQELDLGILRPVPAAPLGIVVTGADDLPLANAWARVGDQVTAHEIQAARLEDGSFQGIAPPLAYLLAGAPGYRTERAYLRRSTDGRAYVRLEPGLRAKVTVRDLNSNPIQGAEVFLVDGDSSTKVRERQQFGKIGSLSREALASLAALRGHTDEAGEVRFAELADTGYIVFVRHVDYLPLGRQYIEPDPNLEELAAELGMQPAPRMRVLVKGADGELPKGVVVGALEPKKRLWIDGELNAAGEVDAVLPEHGDWLIEAWAPGHHLISQTLMPVSPSDLAEILPLQTLTLVPSNGPGIVFLDPAGNALRDVTLTIEVTSKARLEAAPPGAPAWGEVLSGIALEEAALDKPFPHERPRYLAQERGFGGAIFGFEDWPRTKAMNLEGEPWAVFLEPAGDVVVTVVDGQSKPVAGVRVYMTTNGIGKPGAPATDEAGEVRFEDLPAAQLSFKARAPRGEISNRVELDFEPAVGDPPTRVELELPL
ncbi:MAG: carboxypeptidase-like regulatory domain-containing protein [Planctomycetota bacterium]|nr:carboxypeptidase-like regulatory domain-containing protein [Planctomycetota bacterium]